MKSSAILISVLLLIWGCGSESNQGSAVKTKGKPPKEAKQAVTSPVRGVASLLDDSKREEVSPPSTPGGFGLTADQLQKLQTGSAPKDQALMEISPPSKPGERGISPADLEAALSKRGKELDPNKAQFSPSSNPGESALSVAEFDAKLRAAKPAVQNPDEVELVPPTNPGGKRMTVSQFESQRKLAQEAEQNRNPNEIEISPPSNPGAKGMTLSQFKALQEKNPRQQVGVIPPPPMGGVAPQPKVKEIPKP